MPTIDATSAAAIRAARERDPIGHRVHVALAIAHLVCLPLTTSGSSISFGVLAAYALLRLPSTRAAYAGVLLAPVHLALGAWIAWTALSLAWSRDAAQGLDELGAMRMALLPLALWPVAERSPWLIGAALLGVAGQNAAQLLQHLDWVNLRPQDGSAGRVGGWIHPIQTGAWCIAAMGWHLSALLRGPNRLRVISALGLGAAAAGLIATQSRGPWLAAACTGPLALLVIAVRRPETRRLVIAVAVLGAVGVAAAWPVASGVVSDRVGTAINEYRNARSFGEYDTHVGLRVGMYRWGWAIFEDAPVVGVGAGSYERARDDLPSFREAIERRPHRAGDLAHAHPHNTFLHVLATTGTVGGVLLLLFLVAACRGAWRDPVDHPYALGSFFVIVSWIIGAQFDAYHLNGHLLGLIMLAIAVTLPRRPSPEPASPAVLLE